jgi:hypothetical protein
MKNLSFSAGFGYGANSLPKQMRYQAAPLPDGCFPRVCAIGGQLRTGTNRNRAAQRDTLAATFRGTVDQVAA